MDIASILTNRENFNKRSENIVVTNYNTLRFTDFAIQSFLYSIGNPDIEPMKFEDLLRKLLCRKDKSLGIENGIDDETYDMMMHQYYYAFNEAAPDTLINGMLQIAKNQKFTSSISLLSKEYTSYDGDIIDKFELYKDNKELAEYLNSKPWTVLVTDDISDVYDMVKNHDLKIEYKTFIISKLGYNYEHSSMGSLRVKHVYEINEICDKTDMTMYNLFNFHKGDENS